jgi:hypothetical protein
MKAVLVSTNKRKNSPKNRWDKLPQMKKMRIYLSGEYDTPDQADNSPEGQRVWKKWRLAALRAVRKLLPEVCRKLGLPEDTKFGYSYTAGCSCGCSPGYVAETLVNDISGWMDVMIEYTQEDVEKYKVVVKS